MGRTSTTRLAALVGAVAALVAATLAGPGRPALAADAAPSPSSLLTALGDAPRLAADPAATGGAPVVGAAATPDGDGAWVTTTTGLVLTAGTATWHGDLRAIPLNRPVVGIAATPDGDGTWLVASDGGIFTFGDAPFLGSTGGIHLNRPIVAMAPTPSGAGYWLVASDGGIFTFGDAPFLGSTGATPLNRPIVGMAATPSGRGYWLVAADGGIFTFGDAPFLGSGPQRRVDGTFVGMASATAGGYWLATSDGRTTAFGTAPALDAPAPAAPLAPVVAVTATGPGGAQLVHQRGGSTGLPGGVADLLPDHRLVALYGTAGTPALGILGEGTPAEAAQRVLQYAAPYRGGDRPVVPAFELIATVAQRDAGADGDHSAAIDVARIRPYLDAIRSVGGVLVLDLQPGQADFPSQARQFEELLREPDVGLALDPEWRLAPGQVPGEVIGSVTAAEVNATSAWLADLVARHQLPDKLFVVHRFTREMVGDDAQVVGRPGLDVVFHADGFGTPTNKLGDYRDLLPARFGRGFKLFLDEDVGLMSPADVLGLQPPPDLVTYQ